MVLALSDYMLENGEAEQIEGINIMDLAKHVKMAKIREIRGIFRNEMLSGAFFVKRIRKDLLKLIVEHKSNAPQLKTILEKYLAIRKKEADLFIDKEYILKEFDNFEKNLETSVIKLKKYIENTVIIEK
jgi:hypothetical protein